MNFILWPILNFGRNKPGPFTWNYGKIFRITIANGDTCEGAFLDFYEVLMKLLGYHQKEASLQNELDLIRDFDKRSGIIFEWLKKNEKLALDEFGSFRSEWLDEDFETISLSFLHFKEFNVCIKAEEFKNTIQFLSTFDKHY